MDQPRHIQDLADELLSEILYLLDPPREIYNKFNGNGHQAVSLNGEASDLDRFRLVCKRFMRIGTPHKFSRFTLRFSEHGFRRLDELLEMQLACYVKSITYMVRPFYQGSGINLHIPANNSPADSHQDGLKLCASLKPKIQPCSESTATDTASKPI